MFDVSAGTCCAGHTHAAVTVNCATACNGGGTRTQAPKGTTNKSRVDHHDRAGWRGGGLLGAARLLFALSFHLQIYSFV